MRRPDIEKAKRICRTERRMRELVFKNNREKRDKKCKEMDFVIEVLNWFEGQLYEENSLFGG